MQVCSCRSTRSTVQLEPDPATPVTAGVPVIPPPCVREKFADAIPVTGSLNTTVHETELALVSTADTREIDVVVGACVSNA